MKKQLMIVGIIVILLAVGLSGCNENTSNSDEDKLVGTWTRKDMYNGSIRITNYIFYTNKTFKITVSYKSEVFDFNGTWNITDNKIFLISEERTLTANYKFSEFNNDKTLILTDESGESVTLIRQ